MKYSTQDCSPHARLAVRRLRRLFVLVTSGLFALRATVGCAAPPSDAVPRAAVDLQDFQVPDRVHLTGWLGTRIKANETNRLALLDPARLLEGYRQRPGRQTWDGEHVGKWLHAATLAWVHSGDPALRAKLDRTVAELCQHQLDDGYLGTYLPAQRWTAWDVWAHKYNLLGLITYMRYTGSREPLETCRRMADLLCATFGDGPGQRDIITSGYHQGMAATSVLEPMVLLHRLTGEPRYLAFCEYVVRAWEQPNGPKIVSRLLELKRVDKVGNAKAYEMLSCLNGALELHRTTGDPRLLHACLNAWQDIVDHRLYLTGASSCHEYFRDDHDLPNNDNIGETCVTVTWMQFNAQLLRLTGEARFAAQLENVVLNQLLGAQQPDGSAWGYYVQLEGTKPYSSSLDGHCCLSSGPRGLALLPTLAINTDDDGVVINLYEAGTANLTLRDGTPVAVKVETLYPTDGRIRIGISPKGSAEFSVKFRVPEWCRHTATVPAGAIRGRDGYTALRRFWRPGDTIDLDLKLVPRTVAGDHFNQGKAAVLFGPLVLAADESLLDGSSRPLHALALPGSDLAALEVASADPTADWKTWPGARLFRINATLRDGGTAFTTRLVPFADAGRTGARYKVWLPLAGEREANVLLYGRESRSRNGNQSGSINDNDPDSGAATSDGRLASEDWFAVTLPVPTEIRRIVFVQGKLSPIGGWFVGPPRFQVRRDPDGPWETVGEPTGYPVTTANDHGKLRAGWLLKLQLPQSIRVVAVRIVGVPAGGDKPEQGYVSCAELQAFAF